MNDFSKKPNEVDFDSLGNDNEKEIHEVNNIELPNKLDNITIKNLSENIPDLTNASIDEILSGLFKILSLMSTYNEYEDFVKDQGDSEVLHKIWNLQIELNNKLDATVESVINLDGMSGLREMSVEDLDHYKEKADYNKSESSINAALNNCTDITTDYLIAMVVELRQKKYPNSDILDTTLVSEELRYISFQHQVYFVIYPHRNAIKNIATLLVGSDLFYDDLAFESKIRFEIDKFDACNTYGITPNSYDEYINAVKNYINQAITDRNIDIRNNEALKEVQDEAHTQCRQIMKRVPDFQTEYKDKGRLVYKSAFLIRYCEAEEKYAKEIEELLPKLRRGAKSPSEIYTTMMKYKEDMINRKMENKTQKEVASQTSARVRQEKSDVEEFLAKRKAMKVEKVKTSQNQKLEGSGGESYTQSNSFKSRGIQRENKGYSESDTKPLNEEKIVEIVKEDTNTDTLLDLLKNEETVIPKVKEDKKEEVKEEIEIQEPVEVKSSIEERQTPLYNFNEYSEVKYTEPDISILRDKKSISNFSKRKREYLNSGKYSRSIFLLNSNYNVTVNKLKDGAKLDSMVSLIKDMVDAEANYLIKFELLRVVYESLTFEFENVSFTDFLKNTHPSDLTTLFLMFAIVNAPDSYKVDGDILVDIPSLYCTKCNTVAYFKKPIKIQLKSELTRLYNKDLYLDRYPKYRMANYESLLAAYRRSYVGKLKLIKVKDIDGFSYNLVFSQPTLYKTLEVDKSQDSVSLEIFYNELAEKVESNIDTDTSEIDMYQYLNSKTYMELINRYRDLSRIDFESEDILATEMESYKIMKKEHVLLTSILTACDLVKSKLYILFKILKYIDLIEVVDPDSNETLDKISYESGVFELVKILSNLSDESSKELMDIITQGLSTDIKNQDIEFYPDDLKGLLEWDRYYLRDNKGNILTEEEYEKYITSEDEDMNNNLELETRRKIRQDMKTNLSNGMCTCGHHPLVINYTSLLFFSLSKI